MEIRLADLEVSGGIGGIEATYADLSRLHQRFETVAGELNGWAYTDADEAIDPDLVASAVLSPGTFASAEKAIWEATLSPGGLVGEAVQLSATALATRASEGFFSLADEVSEEISEGTLAALGAVTERLLPGLALGGLVISQSAPEAGPAALEMLQRHPGLTQNLAKMLPGMLASAGSDPVLQRGLKSGSALAGDGVAGALDDAYDGIYGPNRKGALDRGEPRRGAQLPIASGVAGLVAAVDEAGSKSGGGGFAIQKIERPGGTSWIIHLPGTDLGDSDSVRDWTGNIHLIQGRDTAYGEAIEKAMVDAGVGRGDPVLLSGHSAGGMQAARLAGDADFKWNVRGVLTAASPVGGMTLPSSVAALSLENTRDLVVSADGADNKPSIGQVTVRADMGGDGVVAAHSLSERYVPLGAEVDASSDGSIKRVLSDWRAAGFVGDDTAAHSTTYRYRAVLED